MTRTSFDMDPFVVTAFGRKVLRTKVVRHNLNPVYDEKMVFQVQRHEQNYAVTFTVIDRDKLSGNDFVASATFPLQTLVAAAPEADSETGLYKLRDPPETTAPVAQARSRFRLHLSRSSSSQSLGKLSRPALKSRSSAASLSSNSQLDLSLPPAPTSAPQENSNNLTQVTSAPDFPDSSTRHMEDPDIKVYSIPLELKNRDRWEAKHSPELIIKAKYMPYHALRQQFWRAMLKQYDADDSGRVSKIELTTMLDTLGSTLKESTIDSFFERWADDNVPRDTLDLTFDQAVICLEDQLQQTQKRTIGDRMRGYFSNGQGNGSPNLPEADEFDDSGTSTPLPEEVSLSATNTDPQRIAVPVIRQNSTGSQGENGDLLEPDDLADDQGEEHVVEIRECPLCHQPRLDKRSDADIITHIATCASQDWRQVNNLVMGGFVTSSQAQRKWYSKVVTKISYGGYRLGANSANILVQDRITGQINEERMSVYVRLGIRLLYKGLKSREMETKRSQYLPGPTGRALLTSAQFEKC